MALPPQIDSKSPEARASRLARLVMPLRTNSERNVDWTLSGLVYGPVTTSVLFWTAKERVNGLNALAGSVWLIAAISRLFRLGPTSRSVTRASARRPAASQFQVSPKRPRKPKTPR